MRTFALRLTALLLLVFALSGLSAAQDAPPPRFGALFELADLVPQDAVLFAAVKSSPDAVAALDAVARDATAGLPGLTIPPVEEFLASLGVPVDEIRPWLGDAMAIYSAPLNDSQYGTFDTVVLIRVSDADAALAFITPLLGTSAAEIRGDVLVVGASSNTLPPPVAPERALSRIPAFNDTASALGGGDYAGLIYMDLPVLFARSRANTFYCSSCIADQAPVITAMMQVFGPVMIGFTRAPDGDLLLDVAMAAGNLNGLHPLGIDIKPPVVSPEALAFVPPEAFAVVQGANLPGFFVEMWRQFGPDAIDSFTQIQTELLYRLSSNTNDALMRMIPFQHLSEMDAMAVADLVLANLLGVTVGDLQNWSYSDYVLFAQVNPGYHAGDRQSALLPIDMAGVFRVGRPQQSVAAFEHLARALQLLRDSAGVWEHIDVATSREAGVNRLDVTIYGNGRDSTGLTISLAVTGTVAILGTSGAVDSALAQAGGETAPWLAEAAANFQPESAFNGALQPSALVTVIGAWMNSPQAGDSARPFLAKLDALTFNFRVAPSGAWVARFAVSLNDPGAMETLLGQPVPTAFPSPATPTPPPVILATPTVTPPPVTALPEATEVPPATLTPEATDSSLMAIGFGLPAFRAADGAFNIGSPDSPYTLIIFEDWACPHCQEYKPVIDQLIAEDVASGQLSVEHRTLPTAGGQFTFVAGNIAECADNQQPGIFWAVNEALFDIAMTDPESYRSAAGLTVALARRFPALNPTALITCSDTAGQASSDIGYAEAMQINSTPAVLLRDADGVVYGITDRSLEGIRAVLYSEAAVPPSGNSTETPSQATRLAELAATQAMAGRATPTP